MSDSNKNTGVFNINPFSTSGNQTTNTLGQNNPTSLFNSQQNKSIFGTSINNQTSNIGTNQNEQSKNLNTNFPNTNTLFNAGTNNTSNPGMGLNNQNTLFNNNTGGVLNNQQFNFGTGSNNQTSNTDKSKSEISSNINNPQTLPNTIDASKTIGTNLTGNNPQGLFGNNPLSSNSNAFSSFGNQNKQTDTSNKNTSNVSGSQQGGNSLFGATSIQGGNQLFGGTSNQTTTNSLFGGKNDLTSNKIVPDNKTNQPQPNILQNNFQINQPQPSSNLTFNTTENKESINKPLQQNMFGNKETNNPIQFGTKPLEASKDNITGNIQLQDNKPISFGNLTSNLDNKTETKQEEKKMTYQTSLNLKNNPDGKDDKKIDSTKINQITNPLTGETKKPIITSGLDNKDLTNISKQPINLNNLDKHELKKQLDEIDYNRLNNKTIEQLINQWKHELDNEVMTFESLCQKLKSFETYFYNNYHLIYNIGNYVDILNTDSLKTLESLQDVSKEQDLMIQTLDLMENDIDKYLTNIDTNSNIESRDHIYNIANETNKIVEQTQKDLDSINSKILQSTNRNEEGLRSINYKDKKSLENINLDNNDLTGLLNDYYNTLQTMQNNQYRLSSMINSLENDFYELKRDNH